jgi:hypothetical protein
MTTRLFQTHELTIAQALITIVCDILFKMALYYFVFEMGYVAHKLESKDEMEYKKKKKYITITKAIIMLNLLVIQMPLATLTIIFSTVDSFKDYKAHELLLMIIVRISVLLCDGFMFIFFGILLSYFIRKKKEVQLSKAISSSIVDTCAIIWIITLTIMKGIHTLTILSLNTVYMLTADRSQALIISYYIA